MIIVGPEEPLVKGVVNFLRKNQINEIQLELNTDEIINSEIKQFFAAWALWRTNKRLVLCFPLVAKKGIGKYLAKGNGNNPGTEYIRVALVENFIKSKLAIDSIAKLVRC